MVSIGSAAALLSVAVLLVGGVIAHGLSCLQQNQAHGSAN